MWTVIAAVVAAAQVNNCAAAAVSSPRPKQPEPQKNYRDEPPHVSSIGKSIDTTSPFPATSMENVMLNIALNS